MAEPTCHVRIEFEGIEDAPNPQEGVWTPASRIWCNGRLETTFDKGARERIIKAVLAGEKISIQGGETG